MKEQQLIELINELVKQPHESEWVMEIKEQCKEKDVAFFFKQWGGTNKKKTGNLLEGKKYLEMPELQEIN